MTARVSSALLICNGEIPSPRLARRVARNAGVIVAADGGANAAREAGIQPDVIIGDLDSVKPATLRAFSSAVRIRVRRQDNTDMEKALDFIRSQGIRRVAILAATGRRVDFTLANFNVVWKYIPDMEVVFVGDGWEAIPFLGRLRMRARVGSTVSLIPFGNCSGITLRGLRYPLKNASMRVGEVGVSNVVTSSPISVTVRSGRIMLIVFR
jgi:thiamine pyrophosphokinase